MSDIEKLKARTELESQNKAFIKHIVTELNQGTTEFLEQVIASDYAFFSPSNSTTPLSGTEMIAQVKLAFLAFPDLHWCIKELYAAEDNIISRFVITGTHKAEYLGIPATGNKIEYSSIVICRIQNGKIVEEREEADFLGVMQQLNMKLTATEN